MKKRSVIKIQSGLTLIEMLIALVLGIFLIGGVLEIFSGNKESSRMLENLSRLQENGRFAMDFISHDVRMAGHRARISGASFCQLKKLPTVISGTSNNGPNGSDTITTQVSDDSCPITAVPVSYSINIGQSGRPGLFKDANEVVEDIDEMDILYGIDSDSNHTPDYYAEAGTAGLDMDQVVSVQVRLTAKSPEVGLSNEDDGRLKKIFQSTIALRNRLP